MLGIITNNQQGVFQKMVIEGVRDIAHEHELYIDSLADKGKITLNPDQVDGILVIANAAPPELVKKWYAAGKPISLVSHHFAEIPIPAVVFNNVQGIRMLVKHLV